MLEATRHSPADAVVMWDTACDPHGSGRPGDPLPPGRPAEVLAAAARATGLSQLHRWTLDLLGADVVLGEAELVPSRAPDHAEDDGRPMALVNTRDGRSSHLD